MKVSWELQGKKTPDVTGLELSQKVIHNTAKYLKRSNFPGKQESLQAYNQME